MKQICKNQDVSIRELDSDDLASLAEYANNPKVAINLRDAFPNPYTLEDAANFLKMAESMNPKCIFAIDYKNNYVGNISLMRGNDVYRKSAEIGYFIGEPFWNLGITTQAVKLITQWGFENLDIVRIHTGIFSFNKASQRVLEKCGFVFEGISKQAIFKNNHFYDEVRYGLTKQHPSDKLTIHSHTGHLPH